MKTSFKNGFIALVKKHSPIEQLKYIIESKHSGSKIYNAVLSKLNRHLKYTGNLPYYPTQISIEPTRACNYRCLSCLHGIEGGKEILSKRDKFMDFEKYKKFIDQIYKKIWFISLTGAGESFLHPNIYEMINYAANKGIFITLENNGSVFDPENLARTDINNIHFGVDCITQENYSKYRIGGNIENVIKRIKAYCELNSQKNKPATVHLRFLINKYTEDDYGKAEKIFEGYDFVKIYYDGFIIPPENLSMSTTMPCSTTLEKYEEWHPRKYTEYNKYRYDSKLNLMRENNLFHEPTGSCSGVYTGAFLNSDGSIFPCCVAQPSMPEALCYGNAFEHSFDEIWNSTRAKNFRSNYKKANGDYAFCKNCPNGRD
ncbi:radical SAM protein [Maridesulfovibrio ferrireducens]|uniref:radical SAM protein n=1 Tax=Maridesulfovibrio ferrireducens TaxID=246191 RepID=UPI001A23C06F|nr:radical SAM protein [Maridesulfovibrio ferrireducens]MBI9112699.1 SPASM domain-containing protein [Maridesulfovibrio ferrireducens]